MRTADHAQLAAGEHGLEHVARVHRALGRAGPDHRVELVDEGDHLALGLADLVEDRLEAVLELAAELGTGDHRAEVEGDDALVAQGLGHVTGDDPLGQPLDDGGLADTRLADQHRVVLGAPRQHLHHPADLVVTADHRVELALAGLRGEVTAEALQCLELRLRVLVGDAPGAAHLGQRGQHRLPGHAGAGEQLGCLALAGGHAREQVLGGDVLVAEGAGLLAGTLDQPGGAGRQHRLLLGPVDLGDAVDRLLGAGLEGAGVGAGPPHHREDDPVGIGEQRHQQVLGLDPLVVGCKGGPLRGGQRLLRAKGEFSDVHWFSPRQVAQVTSSGGRGW